jgi:hypothetical protein
LRASLDILEEALAQVGIVSELVTEDAEGAGGVAEVVRDVGRAPPFDEIGPQGLVLPLEGAFRREEEPRLGSRSYVIIAAVIHI